MNNKDKIIFAIVSIVIITLIALGAYKFTQGNLFNNDGSHIKQSINSKSNVGYKQNAEKLDYIQLLNYDENMDKQVKVFGTVRDKKKKLNKNIEYICQVKVSKEYDDKLKLKYGIASKDKVAWLIKVNIDKKYDKLDVGDNVIIYGNLGKTVIYNDLEIPNIQGVLIELDNY